MFSLVGDKGKGKALFVKAVVGSPVPRAVGWWDAEPLRVGQGREEGIARHLSVDLGGEDPLAAVVKGELVHGLAAEDEDVSVAEGGSDDARAVVVAGGAKAGVGQQEGLVPVEGVQDALGGDPEGVAGQDDVAAVGEGGGVDGVGLEGVAAHDDGVVVGELCEAAHVLAQAGPW